MIFLITTVHRAKFEREAALVADHNAKASDVIELSIGGERFVSVPRATLTQFDDSMLAAMFSGRHKLKSDDTGRVYAELYWAFLYSLL